MSNCPCRYFRFSPCVFLQIQPGYTARGDFLCHGLTGHGTRSLEKGYFSSNIIHKEMIFLGVYFGPIRAALSPSCRLSASVTAAASRLGTWNKVHFGWPAFVDRPRCLQSIRYIKFGIRILAPGSAYTEYTLALKQAWWTNIVRVTSINGHSSTSKFRHGRESFVTETCECG